MRQLTTVSAIFCLSAASAPTTLTQAADKTREVNAGGYYWYRFADQPALLNAGLTPEDRKSVV